MAAIDLIVLGMLKKQALSAYDLQKLVEYRNISKWVKISTPSIYKKVIQLEEKGLLRRVSVPGERTPEKIAYALTDAGERAFERLMEEISCQPIRIFLDFNAVVVNLDSLPPESQRSCADNMERNVQEMRACLEENLRAKENAPVIPEMGLAVLRQQLLLAETMEEWIRTLRERL